MKHLLLGTVPHLAHAPSSTRVVLAAVLLPFLIAACTDQAPTHAPQQHAPNAAGEPASELAGAGEDEARRSASRPVPQSRPGAAPTMTGETAAMQTQGAAVSASMPEEDGANGVRSGFATRAQAAQRGAIPVSARITERAVVRARPGLPWPVIDRLPAGEAVLVLSRIHSWLRVRYGNEREGWIRAKATELSEVEHRRVPERPAPPIVARWRDIEYDVIGQSADAAEVRLWRTDDGGAAMVSAPADEVELLADGITLHDLPVVIGDETVVFPGNQFGPGKGRILPWAREWTWTRDGRLVAHNEEVVWQWHPGTDELTVTERPRGPAKLAPDGGTLAILELCPEDAADCLGSRDVGLLNLDSRELLSLRERLRKSLEAPAVDAILAHASADLHWDPAGTALLVYVSPTASGSWWLPALVWRTSGGLTYFDIHTLAPPVEGECYPRELSFNRADAWRFRPDGRVAWSMSCASGDGFKHRDMVFSLDGELLGQERAQSAAIYRVERHVASHDGNGETGDDPYRPSVGSDGHALVVDPSTRQLWIEDGSEGQPRLIEDAERCIADWLWELMEEGSRFGGHEWDLYGHAGGRVAIILRTVTTYIACGWIVESSSGATSPLVLGSARRWPCYPTGSWRPDGGAFQLESQGFAREHGLEQHWIDGAAAPQGVVAQRVFADPERGVFAALRAIANRGSSAPSHLARWNSDGKLFAIGGHQEPDGCRFGH